jgi:hypothetical protein
MDSSNLIAESKDGKVTFNPDFVQGLIGNKERDEPRRIELGPTMLDISHIKFPHGEANHNYWILLYITRGWGRCEVSFIKEESSLSIKSLARYILTRYRCRLPGDKKEERKKLCEEWKNNAYTVVASSGHAMITVAFREENEYYTNSFSGMSRFCKEKLTPPKKDDSETDSD